MMYTTEDTVSTTALTGTIATPEILKSVQLPSFGQLCIEVMQSQPKEKIEKLKLPPMLTVPQTQPLTQPLAPMTSSFVLNPNTTNTESAFSFVPTLMPINILNTINTYNESNLLNSNMLSRPAFPTDYSSLLSLNPNMFPYPTNLPGLPSNFGLLTPSLGLTDPSLQSIPDNQLPMFSSFQMLNQKRKRKSVGRLNCTCSSTSCMKSYCVCYKAGRFCGSSCSCTNCKNTAGNTQAVRNLTMKTKRTYLDEYSVCRCTRECRQKYCDCRKRGMTCSQQCSCVNCRNFKQQLPIPIEEIDFHDDLTPDSSDEKRIRNEQNEPQAPSQLVKQESLQLLLEAAQPSLTESIKKLNSVTAKDQSHTGSENSEESTHSYVRTPTISPLTSDRV